MFTQSTKSAYNNIQSASAKKLTLMSLLALCLLMVMSVLPTAHAATNTAPDAMVKNVTSSVLTYLQDNRAELEADPDKVYKLVNDTVLPHFDFRYMSQLVLGKHWRTASDSQKDRFTEAFRDLLVTTYSNSLLQYTGQDIEYLPFRAADDADKVTVKVEVVPDAGLPVPIDYQLRQKNSEWKVYDVNIDGLSIVSNYRSSVGSEVSNKSLDQVITDMAAKRQ